MAVSSESQDPPVLESPGMDWAGVQTKADGPAGSLPLSDEMLRHWPSGDLFGLSQNAGMGWQAVEVVRDPFLILSTQGGLRRTERRSPWATTPGTGRLACWSTRRPRSSSG